MSEILTIAAEDYHADPAPQPSLSASIAHILCSQSPAHAWHAHPRLNPEYEREESEAFDIGNVVHQLVLEGTTERVDIIAKDDWRTNAAKDARTTSRAHGRIPLLEKHWQRVEKVLDAIVRNLARLEMELTPFLLGGKPEQTIIWEDRGGIFCRARFDWLHDDLTTIDDLKTTSTTANPEARTRSLFDAGWDIQAAFYRRGLRAITGEDAAFRFVLQEMDPPYGMSVISLGPAALTLAEKKVEYAISLWRDCLSADSWPGYPTQVCYAELPAWEEARWLEKEMRDEVVL